MKLQLLRLLPILALIILISCGFWCLAKPDVIDILEQIASVEYPSRWALGIALMAMAAALFQIRTDVEKIEFARHYRYLMICYCLFTAVYLVAIMIVFALYGFGEASLFWWPTSAVLIVLTLVLFQIRARMIRAMLPEPPDEVRALVPPRLNFGDKLRFHEARMKYAWDWFQYHADQRLKYQ